jgi:hypothetical protein
MKLSIRSWPGRIWINAEEDRRVLNKTNAVRWNHVQCPDGPAKNPAATGARPTASIGLGTFCLVGLMALVGMTACGRAPQASAASTDGEWHEFEGTWTAVGNRTTMALGGARRAAISTFTGSLVLAGRSRPAVGFRSEVLVFNDTTTGMIGRAVWTNEHGDEAYSELRGEGNAVNNRLAGTFVGGTGRFAHITGDYEFSWRFLLENEDGTVEGQSMRLKGRLRLNQPQGGATAAGIH